MPSQGALIAGTGANDASIGVFAWTNPTRINAEDASFATGTIAGSARPSQYLVSSQYAFTIPTGWTILGIVAGNKRKTSGGRTTCVDAQARLVKGGVIQSTNKSTGSAWTTTNAWKDFGTSSDLWSTTWQPGDINAKTFGHAMGCTISLGPTASVDAHRITVTYGTPVRRSAFLLMFADSILLAVSMGATYHGIVGGMHVFSQTRYPSHAESIPILETCHADPFSPRVFLRPRPGLPRASQRSILLPDRGQSLPYPLGPSREPDPSRPGRVPSRRALRLRLGVERSALAG